MTIQKWSKMLKDKNIPSSDNFNFEDIMGNPHTIKNYQLNDLPVDNFSTENSIIMDNSPKFPLFIDPQMMANRFIRKLYATQQNLK
jgi:dynein heavy chain